MATSKLTDEQQTVVDTVLSTDKIVAVNAIAGSGKTATAKAIVEAVKPINGFYTAFNRAIVQDSASKFGNRVECKTVHALAYKYAKPSKPIENFTYNSIKEDISYEEKSDIIRILDDFYRSDSTDLYQYLEHTSATNTVKQLVAQYAEGMLNGTVNPTFNYMLKCLHMLMASGEVSINKDLLILDECQDTTSVTLEIFKLINCPRKVILGDKFQNIYSSFMNTVNAFDLLDDIEQLKLTRSFRCNPEVAMEVERFGMLNLEDDFRYEGTKTDSVNSTICYLSRTNNMLLKRMQNLVDIGINFSTTRPIASLFELPLTMCTVASGKRTENRDYLYLNREYEKYLDCRSMYTNFYDYIVRTIDDQNINSAAHVLMDFSRNRTNIFDLYYTVKGMKPNNKVILSTVHTFKGLEANKVYIEDNLNSAVRTVRNKAQSECMLPYSANNIRAVMDSDMKEILNLYYVALSRARTTLINVDYAG